MLIGRVGERARNVERVWRKRQVLPVVCMAFGLAFGSAPAAWPADVPLPRDVLGHAVGERFTAHRDVVRYFEWVADRSPRVRLFRYGTTYEGRPLMLAFVTSRENLGKLDEFRRIWRRLAEPDSVSPSEAQRIAVREPALVWLSYNVHGNEPSPTETAMLVLHHLASAEDDTVSLILENLVVVIDPCLNPDGRERYVQWFHSVVGSVPNPDPASLEHSEPWPGGRFNHYLFDLNRDWVWQTQRESRARAKIFLQWRPQVHVDFHEMGYNASYFFYPATQPANVFLPERTLEWGRLFGRGNAHYFDKRRWEYFTHESFDLFYPGYGDTWPSLQGAIGMTYEQAGHSRAGLVVRRKDGTLLRLRDRVEHHYGATIATLYTAAQHKAQLLLDFWKFWRSARDMELPAEAYVIPSGQEQGRVAQMVELLLAQGIRVAKTARQVRARRALGYEPNEKPRAVNIPPGSFLIPARQPQARLIATLMEPEVSLPDTFFYDITAWCLPLAFGLKAYRLQQMPKLELQWLSCPPSVECGIEGAVDRAYAFLVPWAQEGAAGLLYRLLEAGARVRVAQKPFVLKERKFGRGTLVIPAQQPKQCEISSNLADSLSRWAHRYRVRVYAVPTGLTEKGPDLGSGYMTLLRKPKIAVVADAPAAPTCYGAVWYLFDQVLQIPFTAVRTSELRQTDLSKYNVLIFPDDFGKGRQWMRALDSLTVRALQDWIKNGGVFVGIKGGAALATQEVGKLCRAHLKREKKGSEGEKGKKPNGKGEGDENFPRFLTLEQKLQERRLERVPGTILQAVVDTTHPLGFGYGRKLMTLKTSDLLLEFTSSGHNVVSYPKNARVGGFLSKKNQKKIAGTSYLVVERSGSGRVILFADDPNFRLFWRGLTRLFLNAIFFGQIS